MFLNLDEHSYRWSWFKHCVRSSEVTALRVIEVLSYIKGGKASSSRPSRVGFAYDGFRRGGSLRKHTWETRSVLIKAGKSCMI